MPGLSIPDLAIRYVWIGAFLLFPLVLIFGWFYDISAEGVKLTPPADAPDDADTSLRRRDHGIIGVLSSIALVVIVGMGVRISQVEPGPEITAVENSIAVLPFAVCEDLASDKKLAGGVTIEVINRLAERGKLKVIAHTSSFTMAGLSLQKAEIARPLGVQYLLAGEMCRDDGDLTLAAELFDDQGFIVWADRYTQEVNQWDQVTDRLATLVATGVAVELGDVVSASPEAPVNHLAYEQLLIGKRHWDGGDKDKARTAFERALQHELDYAEAQFYLALLDTEDYLFKGREESIEAARPKVEKAMAVARRQLELDDRNAYIHYMMARLTRVLVSWEEELAFRWNHADGLNEEEIAELREQFKSGYGAAERHFRTAIALNPSLTRAYTWLADVIENQGVERRNEALDILEDGQLRDPFNLEYNSRVAKRWAGRGRYRQAVELMERFKELPEIPPEAWWWQLEFMHLQNYWDEKAEMLVDMLLNDPGAFDDWYNRWQAWWFVSSLAYLGLYEEAEAWKQRIENMPMYEWSYETGLQSYLWAVGSQDESTAQNPPHSLIEAGEVERAIEQLETTRHQRKLWHERDLRDDFSLASLYQEVKRDDDAAALLEGIVTQLETEFAMGIRQPEMLYNLAEAYARQGRDDEALDMRRKAYDYHELTCCEDLENELDASPWPRFASDPGYISLCERIEEDWERQADRVRSILSRYDVDELLAPLMALGQESE